MQLSGEFSIDIDTADLSEEQEKAVEAEYGEDYSIIDLITDGLNHVLTKMGYEMVQVTVEQVE